MRHDYTLSERDVSEKLLQFTMNKEKALSRSRTSIDWKYLIAQDMGREPREVGLSVVLTLMMASARNIPDANAPLQQYVLVVALQSRINISIPFDLPGTPVGPLFMVSR